MEKFPGAADQIHQEFPTISSYDVSPRVGAKSHDFEVPEIVDDHSDPFADAIEESKRRLERPDNGFSYTSPDDKQIVTPAVDREAERYAIAVNFARFGNKPTSAHEIRDQIRRNPDMKASLDRFVALYEAAQDSGELATEQEVTVDEVDLGGSEQTDYRHTALETAVKAGIKSESELKQLGVLLEARNTPREQKDLLHILIQREEYRATPEELLRIVRGYRTEFIKATEKGLLLHYHQTAIGNLEGIVREGALLSQDEQRRRGKKFAATGARPDVVQMTRDKYDSGGNLLDAGIKESSGNLIDHGGLALVFDESVMNDPNYDSIDKYPSLPSIPLDNLSAVVVDDEKDIKYVKEILYKRGINVSVVPRSVWLKGYKN